MSEPEPDLFFELSGPEAGGPPVVFTHGWLNSGDIWNGVVDELAGQVRSLRWDMRAHGRSAPTPGQYSRAHALADLTRMIGSAAKAPGGSEPAVLVGHSLGGYLSLAQAILAPETVAGLVMVAAGPGFRSPDSREQWNDSVRATAAKTREKGQDLPEGMEELSMHVDSLVMDRMTEITVPVYTVVGENDKRFQASADVFDKNLNVVKRAQVPEAGHMVHVKHPAPVADAVRHMVELVAGEAR